MILLYANHPLVKFDGRYFAKTKNFVDFLSCILQANQNSLLAVPCGYVNSSFDLSSYVQIDLSSERVIELPFYKERWVAPLVSFFSAFKFLFFLNKLTCPDDRIIVGGPGPNSFLFWCSWILPKKTKFAFFIRGDTLKTVKHIYKGRIVYPLAVFLVLLFRQRIRSLLKQGRTQVFVYGKELLSQYPANQDNQHVIFPLIAKDWFRNVSEKEEVIIDESFRVIFVGRLSPEKNILNLIDACYLSKQGGYPFLLTIVGDGPLLDEIQEKIFAYGLQELVQLKGHVPSGESLMEEYDRHNLLCLPSLIEGTPRVIVEAYARGCPVLASDVGSIREMFPDAICFLKATDPATIAEGIRWCSMHRNELIKLTRRGASMVEKFQIEQNALKVISALLKQSSHSSET